MSQESKSQKSETRFVQLPAAPQNASPVPELTSIQSSVYRGPYGNSRYRGNCDGYIIRNLLRYFRPRTVLDPMCGSGTCRDVCCELGIHCKTMDIYFLPGRPKAYSDLSICPLRVRRTL